MIINEHLLLRCSFISSSLVGVQIIDSIIKSTSFKDSNLEYINMSSKLKLVEFQSCNLKNSSLFENKLEDVIINDSDLSNSEIYNTKLKDMDLSTCKLDDVKANEDSLRGVTVDLAGMINIARVFGVRLKL